MLLGRAGERGEIEQALARARSGVSAVLALAGEPGIGKTALLTTPPSRRPECGCCAPAASSPRRRSRSGRCWSSSARPCRCLRQIPAPQAAALEGALALRPAVGAGPVRAGRGHAQPALPPTPSRSRWRCWWTTPSGWTDRARGAAVRLPPPGGRPGRGPDRGPRRRAIPARRGGSAGPPDRRAEPGRGGPAGPRAARRRLSGDCTRPPRATRWRCASWRPMPGELVLAPEGAPLLVSARISRAFLRRAGLLDDQRPPGPGAGRDQRYRRPGHAASGPPPGSRSTCPPGRRPRARGWSRLGTGTVEFRHPLARSAVYADAPASQRRAAHRALAAALPDRDVDRRAWHLAGGRVGHDEAASAALAQVAARSRDRSALRDRRGRVRAGRAARGRRRAAGAAAVAGGRGGLAGRPDRPRGRAARRGPRAGRRCPAPWSRSTGWPGTSRPARGPVMQRLRDPDGGGRRGPTRIGRGHAGRGGQRLLLRGEPGRDAGGRRAGLGRADRRGRRSAPASWPRWPWAWPGSWAVTRPPGPRRCTRR